jgi:hypothetical protein
MAGERLADALEGVLRRHGSVEGCAASFEHPRLLRVLSECWSSTKSEDGTFEICVSPTLAGSVPSFGAEAITIRDEAEVAEGIARAFAVKTRPAVVSA